jgi:hypothetical protein
MHLLIDQTIKLYRIMNTTSYNINTNNLDKINDNLR